jgi:hypothetical protein
MPPTRRCKSPTSPKKKSRSPAAAAAAARRSPRSTHRKSPSRRRKSPRLHQRGGGIFSIGKKPATPGSPSAAPKVDQKAELIKGYVSGHEAVYGKPPSGIVLASMKLMTPGMIMNKNRELQAKLMAAK